MNKKQDQEQEHENGEQNTWQMFLLIRLTSRVQILWGDAGLLKYVPFSPVDLPHAYATA